MILRENRGQLITSSKLKGPRIVANGRADWVGWLEMKTDVINGVATRNTAQVIRDVDPDVLAVIECEGRHALQQFSHQLLPTVGGEPYDNIMLIDGNDDRGIDVGLMTKRGYTSAGCKATPTTRRRLAILFSAAIALSMACAQQSARPCGFWSIISKAKATARRMPPIASAGCKPKPCAASPNGSMLKRHH